MKQDSTDNLQWASILGGIALGAVAMYLADPDQGRRRRSAAQEKMRSVTGMSGIGGMSAGMSSGILGDVVRSAGDRLSGLQAQASRLIGQRDYKPIDDHVLEARVRSKLGRFVSDAHRIDVRTSQGCVTLSGQVLADERQHLLRMVEAIPGVDEVRDRLNARGGYEGESNRGAGRGGDWSTAQILAVVGGGLLGYYGITRRSPAGLALAATGLGLAARNIGGMDKLAGLGDLGIGKLAGIAGLGGLGTALGGFDWRRLLGMGVESEPVRLQKTIEIKAAPETVFEVWSRYENFPHFMSHVVEVRDLGAKRSHWVVKGPAGTDVEWDAVLTESERPTLLAWRSEPGATVENSGSVRLEPSGRGSTRATVTISYTPPAGALGQGIAALLGSDPERELEEDLQRMKQFIERGVPTQDAGQPTTTSGQILH